MKLHWWVTLITLVTICSAIDVERTVAQVQNILQQNSQLPRLSRNEIIQLLNDIRAEDARSKSQSQSQEHKSTNSFEDDAENEISASRLPEIADNEVNDEKDFYTAESSPSKSIEEPTTKRSEPNLMVVLPYTPRDGSTLQELYTKPPRVAMVRNPVTEPTTRKVETLRKDRKVVNINSDTKQLLETLYKNTNEAGKYKQEVLIPRDLQEFLDTHGLSGQPGNDHFTLPLDGFKPLPSLKPLDGSVELPEKILLTYDLIVPTEDYKKDELKDELFEPLPPDFELDTSSSESKKTVLPLELPKSRKPKAAEQSYEPIDYDAVKVIPLQKGVNPVIDEGDRVVLDTDLRKRQTNNTDNALKISLSLSSNITESNTTSDTPLSSSETSSRDASTTEAPKSVPNDSLGADSDTGPSITDLEDSFGGPLPSQPGDAELPPPRKNGFYWMLDWNSFLEVGDGDSKVNIRFEPKLGDPQMFLPVNVP